MMELLATFMVAALVIAIWAIIMVVRQLFSNRSNTMADSTFTFTATDGKRYRVTGIGKPEHGQWCVRITDSIYDMASGAALVSQAISLDLDTNFIIVEPVENTYEVTLTLTESEIRYLGNRSNDPIVNKVWQAYVAKEPKEVTE